MILQIDGRLKDEIHTWGCYYCSTLFKANKFTNVALSPENINSGYYDLAVNRGWMRSDDEYTCYMINVAAFLTWFGVACEAVIENGTHRLPPERDCKKDEFEFLFFKRPGAIGHFVTGDGQGHVEYDSMGESRAVAEGILRSKRIFRRL